MMSNSTIATSIFLLMLAATFAVSFLGRLHSKGGDEHGLAEEKLNKWLVGLSAGAAANSGFVVTAAVGLGYNFEMQWMLGQIGWLHGAIVFWRFFPQRVNAFAQRSRATTMSELLSFGLPSAPGKILATLCAVLILFLLSMFLAAQWLAGQKFLHGAFGFSGIGALSIFAAVILAYTAVGGFRGSIYVDTMQAVIRLVGTAVALVTIVTIALKMPGDLHANLASVSPDFLMLFPMGIGVGLAFALGYAATAMGYGLGQPQVLSRYLAGSSPEETQAAWWIYIGFVQFTWISMTVFGVLLRVVMPDMSDPEAGLSTFFENHVNPVLTGIIVGDVFATIAATSNAMLIAMGQAFAHDVIPRLLPRVRLPLWLCAILVGVGTMALSLASQSNVATLTLGSISLVGAAIAPAVLVKVIGWRQDGPSLIAAVLAGLAAGVLWRVLGFQAIITEAPVGILAGIAASWLMTLRPGFVNMSINALTDPADGKSPTRP